MGGKRLRNFAKSLRNRFFKRDFCLVALRQRRSILVLQTASCKKGTCQIAGEAPRFANAGEIRKLRAYATKHASQGNRRKKIRFCDADVCVCSNQIFLSLVEIGSSLEQL